MRFAFLMMLSILLVLIANKSPLNRARAEPLPPLSLQEYLAIEAFGNAAIDPSGKWLVYERRRPYEENTDFSYRTYAFMKGGFRIWRYNIETGAPAALLPGLDQSPHTFLENISPNGRFITFFQYGDGELRFGVYDNLECSSRFLKTVPTKSFDGEQAVVWTSDETFVVSAVKSSGTRSDALVRATTGNVLASAWQDAWTGKAPTANVIEANFPRSTSFADGDLVEIDANSGEETVLLRGAFSDLLLSPDKTKLFALRFRPSNSNAAQLDARGLCTVDLASHRTKCIESTTTFVPETIVWSPDSTRIAAFGVPPGATIDTGRFYSLQMSSGLLTRYDHYGLDLASARERGWGRRPERPGFLGKNLVVYARAIPASSDQSPAFSTKDVRWSGMAEAHWFSVSTGGIIHDVTERYSKISPFLLENDDTRIVVATSEGVLGIGANDVVERLSEPLGDDYSFVPHRTYLNVAGAIRQDQSPDVLITVRSDKTRAVRLVTLGPKLRRHEEVVVPQSFGEETIAASSASDQLAAIVRQGGATTLQLRGLREPVDAVTVARVNDDVRNRDLGEWRSIRYSTKVDSPNDQADFLSSCILLPPGFDPLRPPPLIVQLYPNRSPNCEREKTNFRLDAVQPLSPYLWASKGYAFAQISLPGHLIRTPDGPISGMSNLVDHALDKILEAGLADKDRLVLFGFSQGAPSALFVAGSSDRFRAVIAVNGWSDFVSHYFGGAGVFGLIYDRNEQFNRYEIDRGSDFPFGQTPFENPEAYYKNSPIFRAPFISAPVLLIHSDMDSFSIAQFDEMFGALLKAGKRVRYVRYWGEGHGPSSPANIRDMWERLDEFLCDVDAQSDLTKCSQHSQFEHS